MHILPGIETEGFGRASFQWLFLCKLVTAEGKGVEGEFGVNGDLGFPGVRLLAGCRRLFPEAGDGIRVVAVVDLDILQALLLGRGDGEVGGVTFDLKSGRWRGGDVLIDRLRGVA